MMNFFKYLFYSLLSLAGVFIGVTLLFAFVIPNPLGVTDRHTIFAANEFSIQEGFRVRDYIDSNNECPKELTDWSSDSQRPEYQYETSIPKDGKPGRTIPMWYNCNQSLDFTIWVRYSIDSDISIAGGKGKEIKIRYGHFTDSKELFLESGQNYEDVQEKLVASKLITSLGSRTR